MPMIVTLIFGVEGLGPREHVYFCSTLIPVKAEGYLFSTAVRGANKG